MKRIEASNISRLEHRVRDCTCQNKEVSLWKFEKEQIGFHIYSLSSWRLMTYRMEKAYHCRPTIIRWFSAILPYLQKSEKWVYCFSLIFRMKSSPQMCCNATVCFKIRIIQFKFCCNFKNQFS